MSIDEQIKEAEQNLFLAKSQEDSHAIDKWKHRLKVLNTRKLIEVESEKNYKELAESMKEIDERAIQLCEECNATDDDFGHGYVKGLYNGYVIGANRQKAIENKMRKDGEASDGYHTFNELYDFRREYNAALVNTGVWKAHKSHKHHSGELCFGGGWFIVVIETPFGQISNHYEDKYWDEFHCEEKDFADEWDGHTEKDVLERLMKCNKTMENTTWQRR